MKELELRALLFVDSDGKKSLLTGFKNTKDLVGYVYELANNGVEMASLPELLPATGPCFAVVEGEELTAPPCARFKI